MGLDLHKRPGARENEAHGGVSSRCVLATCRLGLGRRPDLLAGPRVPEVVSLREFATDGTQRGRLGRGLDPFGHERQAQLVAQGDDAPAP